MAKTVTLKQVAAHVGVSYQTVSKVINHQIQVSRETEQRIWEAINELGYRPNQLARALSSQRSHLIGYSWAPTPPDTANSILDQFLQSMATAAEDASYHLLSFPYRSGSGWVDSYRELIETNRVDGFILSSVEYDDPRVSLLLEMKFPFVAFGRSSPELDFSYVDVDGGLGMRKVAEHLIELGCQDIAVLAWPEGSRVGQNRLDGLIPALAAAGISYPPDRIARGEGVYQFGYEAARAWLEQPTGRRPDAIIGFNDLMSIGAMNAARDLGLQVGRDVAITGFDDLPLTQYMTPGLTTVRQPVWEIGQRVMQILLSQLREPAAKNQYELYAPRLIARESTLGWRKQS